MKKKLLAVASALALALGTAHADIAQEHFSTSQIFDVQWYMSGSTLNASGFNYLYASVNSSGALSAARTSASDYTNFMANGGYIAFVPYTQVPTQYAVANTYGLAVFNSSGQVVRWIDYTGTVTALGNGVIFYNGNGMWGTLISTGQGYSIGGSASFTVTTSSYSGVSYSTLQSYTPPTLLPLSSGQTAAQANQSNNTPSTPTVTGTSTTNTVTTSTTNGTPVVTTQTTNGVGTSTTNSVNGTPVAVTVESLARGAQTAKQLNVNQTFTTTTTTPVTRTTTTVTPFTTVTTTTTPVTTTTTTTPVTTTTYSDNSTSTTNGTPVVTTSTQNQVVTTTQTGSTTTTQVQQSATVSVASTTTPYSTRIDGVSRLAQTSIMVNQALTGGVVERFTNGEDGLTQRIGSIGDKEHGWMYTIAEGSAHNTSNDYQNGSGTYGLGYERMVKNNLVVGVNLAHSEGSLTGPQAGGSYSKDAGTVYALRSFDSGWLVNSTLGYSTDSFTNYHTINALGLANSGSTSGNDTWLHTRAYTPQASGFRLLAGVNTGHTNMAGFTESGSSVSAVTYAPINGTHTTTEYGARFDKQLGKAMLGVEYVKNSDNLQTTSIMIGFSPKTNITGTVGIRDQQQNGTQNTAVLASITWKF
jgi:hypothetical protein